MRPIIVAAGTVLTLSLISGCAGVSMTKVGEADANAACSKLISAQGDDISVEQGISALVKAELLAGQAAKANDDYALLYSATKAINQSMMSGSIDMAQSAWANAAQICNDL